MDNAETNNDTMSKETKSKPQKGNKTKSSRKKRNFNHKFKGKKRDKRNKFVGKTDGMKGKTFQLKSESKSVLEFTKTQEELVRYTTGTYKRSEDLKWMIKNLEEKKFDEPQEPTEFKSQKVKDKVFERRIEQYLARQAAYEEGKSKLWEVVWYQCTKPLQTKLESMKEFKKMMSENDCVNLLKSIKRFMYTDDSNDYEPIVIYKAKLESLICRQGSQETVNNYYTRLKGAMEVLKYHGCNDMGEDKSMVYYEMRINNESIDENVNKPGESTYESYKILARDRFWGTILLTNADNSRFGSLKRELANSYLKGKNEYPTSLLGSYELLLKYQSCNDNSSIPTQPTMSMSESETEEEDDIENQNFVKQLSFANVSKGNKESEVKCYNCNEYGHTRPNCPKKKENQTQPKVEKTFTTISTNINNEMDEDTDDGELGDINFCLNTVAMTQHMTTTQQIILANKELVSSDWILLDTQSTVHIFKNKKLLTNIRHTNDAIRCYCNGGFQDTTQVGNFKGVGQVYYNNTSLANILSFALLSKDHRITCDTNIKNAFTVHDFLGRNITFKCSDEGLYYHKITQCTNDRRLNKNIVLVNTLKRRMEGFTRRELNMAKLTKRIHIMLGRPSYRDFGNIVKWKLLRNCPISFQDVINAWKIFGEDLGTIRGKTVRKKPKVVSINDIIKIPTELLFQLQDVVLCGDIMTVDKMVVFTTISRKIAFTTVDILTSQTEDSLYSTVTKVLSLYKSRNIEVKYLLTDRQFGVIGPKLLEEHGVILNITSHNEHVGEVERNIRVLKERARATKSVLPFKIMPRLLRIALIKLTALWLNLFPRKNGISAYYSPRLLLLGEMTDYEALCQVPFGAYCEVHDEPDPTNTMTARTTPAIAMCPDTNIQKSYNFLSLKTWKVLARRDWTEIPMPESIIKLVEEKGRKDFKIKDDESIPDDFQFQYLDGTIIGDPVNEGGPQPEYTEDNDEDVDGMSQDIRDNDDVTQNDMSDDETITGVPMFDPSPPLIGTEDGDGVMTTTDEFDIEQEDTQSLGHADEDEDTTEDQDMFENIDKNVREIEDLIKEGESLITTNAKETEIQDNESNEEETSRTHDYSLRNNSRDYRFRFGMEQGNNPKGRYTQETNLLNKAVKEIKDLENEYLKEYVLHTHHIPAHNRTCYKPGDGFGCKFGYASHMLLLQMSAKQGIKKFGDRAKDAIKAEFHQLIHGKDVFIPRFFKELTRAQRKKALRAITLIDHKRNGNVKGRTVANGSVQRNYIPKEDASSPTVTTESVFLTAVMNAFERRIVASCDVSGAFLQAFMDEFVIVKFENEMVDLMVATEPSYGKYVYVDNKGNKILYVQLRKAMYGCLRAARLWWKELSEYITKVMGFTINPYDNCVANKTINRNQCTIIWHVDDLKISHVDEKVVKGVIADIEEKFQKMTVNIGRHHTYVGIDFDYKGDGSVELSMKGYVRDAISEFPDKLPARGRTPAGINLFEVNDERDKLEEDKAKLFHRIVAMLLFVSKRVRPDIQVAVAFLTTRVVHPDEDDWKKLARLLRYLDETVDLPLRLECDKGVPVIKWWVDASYAVHKDYRSHTGAMLSLGNGSVYSKSSKQRINSKSSTEAELIAASDMSGQILWTLYFLKEQGYDIQENLVYQDNKSAILLEKNGKLSSSQRTRHINIRYFFIKDRVENGEVQIVYCPTDDMLGDFFTKPLQGQKFIAFRNKILGLKDEVIQEGVEENYQDNYHGNDQLMTKPSEF